MRERKTVIEALIADEAGAIAAEMNRIARWAKSEEDVRHRCNNLVDGFISNRCSFLRNR